MPRKTAKGSDQNSNTDMSTDQLPTFDGTQLDLGIWLRTLGNLQHLLPQDLVYFVITGAYAG